MKRGLLTVLMVVGAGLVGCTSKTSPQPANQAAAPQPEPKPVAVPVAAAPHEVVTAFLDSLRRGDRATAAHLLTTRARVETTKAQMVVDPPAAPNAKYEVHGSQILADNPNGAHVTSVWSGDDSEPPYNVVWVLRKQNEGWRIAGMALQLVPETEPAFLNFEDPEDMKRKAEAANQIVEQQLAAEAAAQQAAAAAQQGQGPGGVAPVGVAPPGVIPSGPASTAFPAAPSPIAPATVGTPPVGTTSPMPTATLPGQPPPRFK